MKNVILTVNGMYHIIRNYYLDSFPYEVDFSAHEALALYYSKETNLPRKDSTDALCHIDEQDMQLLQNEIIKLHHWLISNDYLRNGMPATKLIEVSDLVF
ncbi:hypothetical protein [Morganella morganii]|uniref:hypothetical protein n=1 Tax=Morganella morganii TaxID=582 RepID=UPI003B9ED04C